LISQEQRGFSLFLTRDQGRKDVSIELRAAQNTRACGKQSPANQNENSNETRERFAASKDAGL
jgi:hypothetical protein